MASQQVGKGVRIETGEWTAVLSAGELRTEPQIEREIEIVCASGDRTESVWKGLPISALVEEYPLPVETTHLSFTSRDGYRCCIDLRTALDGVLATERDGTRIGSGRSYAARFVAPGIEGTRCLKDIRTVRPLSLEAGEPRTDYEQLTETRDDSS